MKILQIQGWTCGNRNKGIEMDWLTFYSDDNGDGTEPISILASSIVAVRKSSWSGRTAIFVTGREVPFYVMETKEQVEAALGTAK